MNEINEQPIRDRYCTHCGNLMDGYRYAEGYLSDTSEYLPFWRSDHAMSSEIGSITNCFGFWELYSSSKAALNMLMKAFSARHPDDPRALLLVAPGWVRTEMGGEAAPLEISDSIPLVVDMVERSAGVPGLRFTDRHGEIIPW
jgi:NAD(P)-dependent dehydrogenase (short-subunit alcohol dehydrogenase family)